MTKTAPILLAVAALAVALAGCKKGNDKGCKIEDQCGRILEQGSNPSCSEIKCVPNACEKNHMTALGRQICDKGAVVMPNASAK